MRRISNQEKRLKGTDQKCRMRNEAKLVAPTKVADYDIINVQGLQTPRSVQIYRMSCKRMAALGIMDEAYQEALVLYSYWLDVCFVSMEKLNEAKEMIVQIFDAQGNPKGFALSPYVQLLEKATKQVNEIGKQFGFTPISRANLNLAEKELNPVEELGKLMG